MPSLLNQEMFMRRWKLLKRLRKALSLSEISSKKEKKEIRQEVRIHVRKTEIKSLLIKIRTKRETLRTTETQRAETVPEITTETETLPEKTIKTSKAQMTETTEMTEIKISPRMRIQAEVSETTSSRDLRKMIPQQEFLYLTV